MYWKFIMLWHYYLLTFCGSLLRRRAKTRNMTNKTFILVKDKVKTPCKERKRTLIKETKKDPTRERLKILTTQMGLFSPCTT